MSANMPVKKGTTTERIERKYPLPEEQLDARIEELRGVLPVYRHNGAHDWSSLRTIYLDTHDQRAYQEYLQNLPVRRKIRIREYGVDGRFDGLSWVELKEKNRALSRKWRFRCRNEDVAPLLQGEDILGHLDELNSVNVRQTYRTIRTMIVEQHLSPAIRVEYERLAFQREDDPLARVTLDRGVRFFSVGGDPSGRLDGLVLELKHHGPRPKWMRSLPRKLGVRREKRFSKFARSVRKLNGFGRREENS